MFFADNLKSCPKGQWLISSALIPPTMPYNAEISRANPGCFLFLVDQSASMADPMPGDSGGGTTKKSEATADVLNKFLQNLVIKCGKGEEIRDWFHVGVIGYGDSKVGSAFGGAISGRDLVPISEIGKSPSRIEERNRKISDGAGGLVEQRIKFPVWFDAVANGGTPMCQALAKANEIVSAWVGKSPTGFPPIVVNVTDGEANDGDPSQNAGALKSVSTTDGNVLLFNIHLSSKGGAAIDYPDAEVGLPDDFAKTLFNMSSLLTETMQTLAIQKGYKITANSRGFVFNSDLVSLIDFLDIGTRPSNLR